MAGKLNKHDVPTPQQRGSPAFGLQTKFRFSKSENKLNQKEKSEQNLKHMHRDLISMKKF